MQRIQGKMLNRRALHSRLPPVPGQGTVPCRTYEKVCAPQNRIDVFKRPQIDLNRLSEG